MYAKHSRRAAVALLAALGWASVTFGATDPEEQKTPLRGDLNGNGIHDASDLEGLKAVLEGAKTEVPFEVLDVDANGRLDEDDLAMLENWVERTEAQQQSPDDPEAPRDVLRGDVDGDGDIDVVDAILMQEIVMGLQEPKAGPESADVNEDGRITLEDLFALVEILYGRREPTWTKV